MREPNQQDQVLRLSLIFLQSGEAGAGNAVKGILGTNLVFFSVPKLAIKNNKLGYLKK